MTISVTVRGVTLHAPDWAVPLEGFQWVFTDAPIKRMLLTGIGPHAAEHWEDFADVLDFEWVADHCWRLVPYVIEETP